MQRTALAPLTTLLLTLALAPASALAQQAPALLWSAERAADPALRAQWATLALRNGGALARTHLASGEAQTLRALESAAHALASQLVTPEGALRGDGPAWLAAAQLFDELGQRSLLSAQEASERASREGTVEPPESPLDLRCALAAQYRVLTAWPAEPSAPALTYSFAWSLGEVGEYTLAAAAWRSLVCPSRYSLPATLDAHSLGNSALPEPWCAALTQALADAPPYAAAAQSPLTAEQYLSCPALPSVDRARLAEQWFRLGEAHFEGSDPTQQLQELPLAAAAYRQTLRTLGQEPAWLDAALALDGAAPAAPAATGTVRVTALSGGASQEHSSGMLSHAGMQWLPGALPSVALYKLGWSYRREARAQHAAAACFAELLTHPASDPALNLATEALGELALLELEDEGPAPPAAFERACQRLLAPEPHGPPPSCGVLYRLLGETLGGALPAGRTRRGSAGRPTVPLVEGEHDWTPALWAETARRLYEMQRVREARWLDALLLQRYPRFAGADAVRARREGSAQN